MRLVHFILQIMNSYLKQRGLMGGSEATRSKPLISTNLTTVSGFATDLQGEWSERASVDIKLVTHVDAFNTADFEDK